jgi:hypothetical protein
MKLDKPWAEVGTCLLLDGGSVAGASVKTLLKLPNKL